MRRTAATLLALLATTAPAQALTAHAAKHAIKREYLYATPDAQSVFVTVDNCRRLARDTIRCRVVDEPAAGCFLSQLWDATRWEALTAPVMHDRAWGTCPETMSVAPVDGQPTYLPPGS